ncbi:hypothetical protein COL41_28910 [Bacillus mycoides]|uniref:hypothetical protein n=1 Tax=Bacillus mycoides TaxID=1405 RepID=UPI000BF561E7|nr:hypothetical protein [Bacillus mycoides]MED1381731.1 hypothetical protein [Bacillus mycoides]PFX89415.1 hypothetical protein COL41_28910 [Bacillus mycoides]
MDSTESLLHIIKQSIKKSWKLIIFSAVIIICLTIILYLLFLNDKIQGHLDTFMTIFGFCSTIYSVFLTILLYQFISFSDTEFIIDSNKYVERNKELIMDKTLNVSNFIKEAIQLIHTDESRASKIISADVREDFLYLKNLNKNHINERTSLYKCRKNFAEFETIVAEIQIAKVSDICTIEIEKLVELWSVLMELTLNLNTIFNKE